MSGGNIGDAGGPISRKPRARKRPPSPYADKPYAVGKGKPPVHSQFKAGQKPPKGGGRPKGSTKASSLQRLLAKSVMVNGPDGRRTRKTLGEVIDHKLVEMAAKGDLDAIKLIKQVEIQMKRFGLIEQPSEAEIRQKILEEQQLLEIQERTHKSMCEILDFLAQLKRRGLLEYNNDQPDLVDWIYEEAIKRKEPEARIGPDPSTWGK